MYEPELTLILYLLIYNMHRSWAWLMPSVKPFTIGQCTPVHTSCSHMHITTLTLVMHYYICTVLNTLITTMIVKTGNRIWTKGIDGHRVEPD